MRTTIETATVTQAGAEPAMVPVTVVSFGAHAEPLSLEDQERELLIQIEGLQIQREMLVWERTGDFGARGQAERHRLRMEELIKGRSDAVRARMAQERGLPHG
ncbi:hypothetical protein [Ottowia sp. VDI28]|uniref:hypothetical protein n=1 Tax=Ottowia sp. VDI28 TaxID=3133968 RepID=UPI003C2DF733